MSLASKLCLVALAAGLGLAVYEWDLLNDHPEEMTQAALRQFDSSAAPQELRVAGAARHWWPLAGIGGLAVLAALLFRDDALRWWKRKELQKQLDEHG
jgi:hypothetical protein